MLRPFVDAGSWLDETLARTRLGRDDVRFRRDVVSARAPSGSGARATPPSIPAPSVASPLVTPLSDREAEILALLADRLTNKEIAERLSITPETVKRHTANIYQKLDVHGRREAVERARSLGVLQSP